MVITLSLRKLKINKQCTICKKIFETYECHNRKYCSNECYYNSLIGSKQSSTTILKRSKSLSNRKLSEEHKKKIGNSNRGKKHSREFCDNIVKNNRKRIVTEKTRQLKSKLMTGNLNPAWKGGVTAKNYGIRKSIDYKKWRTSVFKRDKYTCQLSGQISGLLVAHHIESFSTNKEKRLDINNGFTITKELHFKFHKIYGKKNNTREQLEEFKEVKKE